MRNSEGTIKKYEHLISFISNRPRSGNEIEQHAKTLGTSSVLIWHMKQAGITTYKDGMYQLSMSGSPSFLANELKDSISEYNRGKKKKTKNSGETRLAKLKSLIVFLNTVPVGLSYSHLEEISKKHKTSIENISRLISFGYLLKGSDSLYKFTSNGETIPSIASKVFVEIKKVRNQYQQQRSANNSDIDLKILYNEIISLKKMVSELRASRNNNLFNPIN